MNAIVAGTDDHDIAAALEAEGVRVARVDVANRPALEEAGVLDADTYVLTEAQQATSISVAHDLNADLHVVVYADESLPEFAQPLADLIVDPALIEPATLIEELR